MARGRRRVTESLAAYTIEVHRLYHPGSALALNDFDGKGGDVLAFLHDHLDSLKAEKWDDQGTSTQLWTRRVEIEKAPDETRSRTLLATVVTGAYGERSTFRDRTRPIAAIPDFERTEDHTEERPFHIRAHLPAAPVRGLILTQVTGNAGVRQVFWEKSFKQAFRGKWPEHNLRFEHLYPENVWNTYKEHGSMFSARVTKIGIPQDIARRFGVPIDQKDDFELQLVVAPKRGRRFRSLVPIQLRERPKEIAQALTIEIDGESLEMDEMTFSLDIDGQEMTIEIREESAPRARYRVSEVAYDETDGYPTFESVQAFAKTLETHLANYLW